MSRAATPRQLAVILGVSASYILAAVIAALIVRNREFLFYIVVMVVLLSAILLVHRRVGLSAGLLWCMSAWGALHMAGGLLPVPESWPINGPHRVLYSLWMVEPYLKFDQLVHAYGFAITTWLCWEALRAGIRRQCGRDELRPTMGVLTLCAAGGMGFGAFNEVVEFIATRLIEGTNVGGYVNTGWDLVANMVGCIIAAVVIRFGAGRSQIQ